VHHKLAATSEMADVSATANAIRYIKVLLNNKLQDYNYIRLELSEYQNKWCRINMA
jgi:hypothetical protein